MKNKNILLGLAAAAAAGISIQMIMKARKASAQPNVHEMLDDMSLRLNKFLAERKEKPVQKRSVETHPSSQAVS